MGISHSSQLHSPIETPPETVGHQQEALRSREWDVGDGSAPRLKYAIFYLARTGSVFLSACLRRRGIGVALEYLGVSSIAARLGCLDEAGNTRLGPYFAQLLAKRTTPNGIFGIKIHPVHLRSFAGDNIEVAAAFFRHFDRVLVLRRRDKLLQAISMVRARFTEQFHLFAGDAERPLTHPDGLLFGPIATVLADIAEDEHYMERVLALLDRAKVTRLWCEELSESVSDRIAADLAAGAGHTGAVGQPYADQALPRRGNTEEAQALKRRFLAYLTGEVN